jgi:hypothetical protein
MPRATVDTCQAIDELGNLRQERFHLHALHQPNFTGFFDDLLAPIE